MGSCRKPRQPSPQPPRRVPLRFLKLPGLAQENILKRVDLFDVVSLSLCSTRTSKAINLVNFLNLRDPEGPLTGGGVRVEFTKDHVSVVFQDQGLKCSLRVQTSEDVKDSEDLLCTKNFRKVNSYDNSWWSSNDLKESNWVADYLRSQMMKAAKNAIEHICFIFRLPVIRVSVNVHEIPNFTSLFIWDLLRGSCPDVQLHGYKRYDDFKGKILNSEISKFFRKVRVKKRFALDVENSGNMCHQSSKLRNLDSLVLQNASWMQDHHFKQLNCEFLEVHNSQITVQAINDWLTKWMNSSDTKTKVLKVNLKKPFNINRLFEGLTYAKQYEQKTAQYGKFGSFTRHIYGSTSRGVMIPHTPLFTLTRPDGAVAKIPFPFDSELCVYMKYGADEEDVEEDDEDEEIDEDDEEEDDEDDYEDEEEEKEDDDEQQ